MCHAQFTAGHGDGSGAVEQSPLGQAAEPRPQHLDKDLSRRDDPKFQGLTTGVWESTVNNRGMHLSLGLTGGNRLSWNCPDNREQVFSYVISSLIF
jgi:hypothetical protein